MYKLMLRYLPHFIMYKRISIDTQHRVWVPRFGYTKKQVTDAKKQADELYNDLIWD